MRVLLIDDEVLALNVLASMLTKLDDIVIVGKYTDPEVAYQELSSLQVDVILLDMDMGPIHGIGFAEKLLAEYSHLEIIFVTAHPQFALEAFNVNAIDYLLKPVNMPRLKKAMEKTKEKIDLYYEKKASLMRTNLKLYVYTMNGFRLLDFQNNEVKWRTRKVKELFVFLWNDRERQVHKTKIIEELWPEVEITKAITLLHTTVYQLRKTLKEIGAQHSIKLVNDHYQLNISINSDIEELEAIIKSGELTPVTIERVLELYEGDYLEKDGYTWAFHVQHRIKQSVLSFLNQYINLAKKTQMPSDLIEKCLEKMLTLDMYNVNFMYQFIEYYGRTNNIIKMKKLYEWIVEIFEVELGISVPSRLVHLYENYMK